MNQKSKRLSAYFKLLPITSVAAFTLRTVALLTSFDFLYGYFNNNVLITIANVLTVAACFLFLTYIFVSEKDKRLIASFSTPVTYVPTGAVFTALVMLSAYIYKRFAASGLSVTEAVQLKKFTLLFELAISVLSLVATVYFILAATLSERACNVRAGFGIFTVLFLALYAAFIYFDASLPMNAPNKTVDQMAILFCALFFLYETRISLGREKWHLYIGFGLIAAQLAAYSAIPSIIVYFVNGRIISASIYENVLTLTLCIFILARLAVAHSLKSDEENSFIAALRAVSSERQAKIEEKDEARRRAYIELMNRMSRIEDEDGTSGFEDEENGYDVLNESLTFTTDGDGFEETDSEMRTITADAYEDIKISDTESEDDVTKSGEDDETANVEMPLTD